MHDLSWKVGGQQGEKLESTELIFAGGLCRLGYYLYGYRVFSSRIMGGHTNNQIRISTKPLRAIADHVDILVAFDQETIDLNAHELRPGGVIIADAKLRPVLPDGLSCTLIPVPFTSIAEELGSAFMKNMVAVGASAALLGLPIETFHEVAEKEWLRKGIEIVEKNKLALSRGAQYIYERFGAPNEELRLHPADGGQKWFMIGNDAIGLGAIAAGCRFMAAYPITPASEIMEYLIPRLPQLGGTVIQTEDEIAALMMAIGANYGGVRAFTASSGPGLSLMMEGIGLAGMTETPVVIVDTQRGGPSTGLPTKHEQSDLNAVLYGTHGETQKIVLCPSTVEECFYDMVLAFNLAEQFQCPVIILTDLQLSLGKQSAEPLRYSEIVIDRGALQFGVQPSAKEAMPFKRYAITDDGVSPRVLPGTKNGMHSVTGVEHNESGWASEDPHNRQAMMDKRLRKLDRLKINDPFHAATADPDTSIVLMGMGSTGGAIAEVRELLAREGIAVNQLTIRLIQPLPMDVLAPYLDGAGKIIVFEHNATGQLASLLQLHYGKTDRIVSELKFDGSPFRPSEIYERCKAVLAR
ncbi:2-oxoacid:acceptor oxidoreductase subunit alpha [Paenibacillus allorhizosphaerae]|uniref:2-oxoglutarate oxidoreductase subunit KorA n=1 Tax=Paenibacillus allorhizosphaerae TaxID=2849866 RepID=A0ABN7TJ40_9BACL|nr:2-oxoacid:acceptor oxidoreductase subunit alpha [Paenibacillus allorhizosphaerae]CAG7635852.1 2-oxoglutarate oxidoreductase subunit KorA [Paenibacillus allorhizosphaerae]